MSETVFLSKDQAKALVAASPVGRTLVVGFTKRNGEARYLTTIVGIDFGVQGFGAPYDAREKGIVHMYDVNLAKVEDPENCWRAVRLDSITSIETEGKMHIVR